MPAPTLPQKFEKTIFPVGGRGEENEMRGATDRVEGDDPQTDEETGIIPEGYESEAEFLNYWLKQYTLDYAADKHNRDEAMEDLRFIYVDQWDKEVRAEREKAGRPCITINTLPQFIGQVVGDRRINKTSIRIIPDKAANSNLAKIRAGIIRGIESFSDADRVYDACCEDQVGCGLSNFEITLEYARNDVFEQDLFVRQMNNPFAVTWDRMSRDPTGKDARHCFVEETIPQDVFEEEYRDAPIPTSAPAGIEHADWSSWHLDDTVKVVALWIMVEKPATFALMEDGQVEDVTDIPDEQYAYRLWIDPRTREGFVRDGVRTYAQRWLITGHQILEGPYELPLSRLPIIKVSGRVGRVGIKQYRFGLVRWARDPSLMRNYWRSIAVETLAMAPKNQWLADAASVKGREDDFRAAHLTSDPLLIYNTGKNKPERAQQPELPAAVLNESQMNAQDIKDVTGIHDASLGIRSNEVSGKAIMARQREGDVASITYHDNLNLSIQEAGRVLNELLPIAYDTMRTVRVVGEEDEIEHVTINDPLDEASPDITVGRYDVKVTTGPSYTTRRQEASEFMLEATKTMPEYMSQALDIVIEEQDVPGAGRIAKRLRRIIPAAQEEEQERAAKEAEASGQPVQPTPEQMAAQQAQMLQQQMLEQQMAAAQAQQELELAEKEAKVREAEAQAESAEAAAEKARQDVRAAKANADRAEALAEQADDDVVFNEHRNREEIRQKSTPKESGGNKSGTNPRQSKKGKRK